MRGPDRGAPVLAVCGLAFEARVAAGAGVSTIVGAGRSSALAEAIEREIAGGIAAILSFGVAGGLVSSLRSGSLVIGTSVVGPDATYPVDPAWSSALRRALPAAVEAPMAGVDAIVSDPAAKRALALRTRAATVDMESHIAARIAARHGLPFAALRAVTDPLDRALPPAAAIAMKEDGAVDLLAVMRSLAARPGQLPDLLRSGLETRRALRALGQGRRLLGRRLGYLDLDQLPVDVV